jgi:membrane glycosyltransferase
MLALWAWTLSMLFLPACWGCWPSSCGVSSSIWRRLEPAEKRLARKHAGPAAAPVRMLAHSLFVLVALTGIALDWKSRPAKRKPFHGATPWLSWPP